MQGVLDIIQQQTGRPRSEFEMSRVVDESSIDELERENFFKRIDKSDTEINLDPNTGGFMIARIKHIGIMSQNALRMSKFYECRFDLRKASNEAAPSQEAERGRSFGHPVSASKRVASPFDRTVIASNGNIGVAFNRRRPSSTPDPEGNFIEVSA